MGRKAPRRAKRRLVGSPWVRPREYQLLSTSPCGDMRFLVASQHIPLHCLYLHPNLLAHHARTCHAQKGINTFLVCSGILNCRPPALGLVGAKSEHLGWMISSLGASFAFLGLCFCFLPPEAFLDPMRNHLKLFGVHLFPLEPPSGSSLVCLLKAPWASFGSKLIRFEDPRLQDEPPATFVR